MNQWYLSKNGQALGPMSTDKVVALIHAGEVSHLDLVYQAGDSEWQPISKIPEFAESLAKHQESEIPEQSSTPVEWVLLKKVKGEKGSEYKQLGPFSQAKVLELIDGGEIRFADFAWRKGMESWVRIGELEPFTKPLPSSPDIDATIYESTNSEIELNTVTDQNRPRMTEMVKIERFEPSKEDAKPTSDADTEIDATLVTGSIPLTSVDSATDSVSDYEPSESAVDHSSRLWSLEPPTPAKKKIDSEDADEKTPNRAKNRVKKIKVTAKKDGEKKRKKRSALALLLKSEVVQYAAAGLFLIFAGFALLASFNYTPEEEIEAAPRQIAESYPRPAEPLQRRVRQFERNLEAAIEKVEKRKPVVKKVSPPPVVKSVAPKPKPLKTKPKSVAKKVVKKVAPKPVKKVVKKSTPKPVAKKAKPKPKPVVKKKKVAKKVKKKPVYKKKKKSSGLLATGTPKAKSYYHQRDRKAIFYTSYRAELLAVKIKDQFVKLKKNKSKWSAFYRGWRKEARTALAPEIRDYPVRGQKYAYPKVLENFKRDYAKFYDYGAALNAQVMGSRVPSSAPRDILQILRKYKTQAQKLGR